MTPYGSFVLTKPQDAARGFRRAKVLAIGDGSYAPDGTLQAPRVTVGDVIFIQNSRLVYPTVDAAGNDAWLVNEQDIVAIE